MPAELADRLGDRRQAVDYAQRAMRMHRRLGLAHRQRRSVQQLSSLAAAG